MKRAFTLIELLVVLGILGVLMAVLIGTFAGSTEAARSAKCLSNLKNLATAMNNYSSTSKYYPTAGNQITYTKELESVATKKYKTTYYERKGWISWYSPRQFPSTVCKSGTPVSMYEKSAERVHFALTNGVLFAYLNGDASVFVCPEHARKHKRVNWSYLMNANFGWDAGNGSYAYSLMTTTQEGHAAYGDSMTVKDGTRTKSSSPDRILLFSEVPFRGPGSWFPSEGGSEMDLDAILQYPGCDLSPRVKGNGPRDGYETIGGNHKNNTSWCAHVVFADGHVEKIRVGTLQKPMEKDAMRDVTTYLCNGLDITLEGHRYRKLDD